MYACKRATKISIIEIENANANERLEPNQFLKININEIRLISTMCPADMLTTFKYLFVRPHDTLYLTRDKIRH